MIPTVACAAGIAAGAVVWALLGPTLRSAPFQRRNYRDHELPTAAGLVVVAAVLGVAAVWLQVELHTDHVNRHLVTALEDALVVALGFGLLGLLDDLAGDTGPKGFGGHVRALVSGRLTTGMLKLAGGGLVALAVTAGEPWERALLGAAVIALAANAGNLFDRAPGRVVKVDVLVLVPLVPFVGRADGWSGALLAAGAGVALLPADLGERCMLGDTGANVLGAAVGAGFLASGASTATLWLALAVLVALNGLAEVVSFSRVIDRVPPLRWLDRLGTLPERRGR